MAKSKAQLDSDDSNLLAEAKALMEPVHSFDDKSQTNDVEIMECPICLQICVHPSKLPCGHIFCFLCVKGLKNRRCAMCRSEFPVEFLERPELLMPIDSVASTSNAEPNEYQWFYKGRNGWWQYDERTCQEIEDAYKTGEKYCTILVAGYVYVVDFDQMLQQRQTDPSRKRQVKRDLSTIPKKGVAGLRLPNSSYASNDDVDGGDGENSNSNIIATIAATEAAIRIASDIIDSTLAHADDQMEQNTLSRVASIVSDGSRSEQINRSTHNNNHSNRRGLLDEIEETLTIENPSSINTSFGSTSTNLEDFFTITLDDFKNLTMSNIADDSSDENNDDDDDDDDENYDNENCGSFGDQTSARH